MGDRHGGRFARRGRALNPPRPQVDAHRGVGLRWRATVFRCRGVVGRICPRARTLSSAKASRHGARAKGFARAGTLPTAKASRHGARAKGFARAETRPSAKASRHGAQAKGFASRRNTPLGEGLPTRRTSERFAPRGSPSPHVPTNGGPPSTDGQPEKHPFGGVAPETARPLPSSFTEKNKTTP